MKVSNDRLERYLGSEDLNTSAIWHNSIPGKLHLGFRLGWSEQAKLLRKYAEVQVCLSTESGLNSSLSLKLILPFLSLPACAVKFHEASFAWDQDFDVTVKE